MNLSDASASIETLKSALAPPAANATEAERTAAPVRTPFLEVALGALHTAAQNLTWHTAAIAARPAAPPPSPASPPASPKPGAVK